VEFLPDAEQEFWNCGMPLVGPPEEILESIKYVTGLNEGQERD
jgi:hypothetical protein